MLLLGLRLNFFPPTRRGSEMQTRSMDSWHSYPSIYALGHRCVTDIMLDPVLVEEKIDGSQFSFGRFEVDGEIQFFARSKGAILNVIAPEKMFERAVAAAQALDLRVGWTYRAEYLQRPKHNSLAYDRVPKNHLMVFDINTGHECYLPYKEKAAECERIGLEVVPLVYSGIVPDAATIREFLSRTSVLGGQKIEGVVIKNYTKFGPDKKALMAKFVSEAFKEVHAKEWKSSNPTGKDIIDTLIEMVKTPARWGKAIIHLRERGLIEDSPRDIGHLIKEVQADIQKECAELVAEKLVEWAMPKVIRGSIGGLPEWYKDELLKRQFETK